MEARTLIKDPNSCLAMATEDEQTFLLLARDPVAPMIIRAWCYARMQLGVNKPTDEQISEAMLTAAFMDEQRPELRLRLGKEDIEAKLAAYEGMLDKAKRSV